MIATVKVLTSTAEDRFVQIATFGQEFTPPVTAGLLDELHALGFILRGRRHGPGRGDVVVVGERCWRRDIYAPSTAPNRWTAFSLQRDKIEYDMRSALIGGLTFLEPK